MAANKYTGRAIGALVVGAVAGAACAFWTLRSSAHPLPAIPTPVMPNPNAYDILMQAAALRHETDAISYGYGARYSPTLGVPKITTADDDTAAASNLAAVAKMREAFRYPCLFPPVRGEREELDSYRSHAPMRSLARILAFEGQYAAAHGRYDEAMDYFEDGAQLGSDVCRGADMPGTLTGWACDGLTRRHAWSLVDHMSERAAQREAVREYAIANSVIGAGEALKNSRWSDLSVFEDQVNQGPRWRDSIYDYCRLGTSSNRLVQAGNWLHLQSMSKNAVLRAEYDQYNAPIRLAALPYPVMARAKMSPAPFPFQNAFDHTLLVEYRWQRERCVTFDYLLATQLALRAYSLDHHGAYPTTLQALAPGYLPAVPVDPLSDDKPLQYRLTGKSYVLYSIGPDGKDDGGAPICDTSRSHPYSLVGYGQKGDIVAGVNY